MPYEYPVGPISDAQKIHLLEERVAALERLLLTVAQALFYHKESHAEAGSSADEELAGTVELLREARAAQLRP